MQAPAGGPVGGPAGPGGGLWVLELPLGGSFLGVEEGPPEIITNQIKTTQNLLKSSPVGPGGGPGGLGGDPGGLGGGPGGPGGGPRGS